MSSDRTCPDCGAFLPFDAPRGLCPACLMGAAFSRISMDGPRANGDLTISMEPADPSLRQASALLAELAETVSGFPRVLLRDTDDDNVPDQVIQPASTEVRQLAGRSAHLQLFGEIARGGMGAVLKGRDVDLGRDLAIKVLLEKHCDRPEMIRRFIEEAQIAGQLQHPGVVPVYELGAFADHRPYFAMKLVKGRNLAAVLADRGKRCEDLMGLLATLLQMGQTVAFAHARGVIHRDLKPSNVMVGSFGEVQVMDWGLAKVLLRGGAADDAGAGRIEPDDSVVATARSRSGLDQTQSGSVIGTPAYMAPEQARGDVEQVDQRVDVFALGAILCEVLTGGAAFTGRSLGEIQRKADCGDLTDAFNRLDVCAADCELIALAKDCLAPRRDDRPRDASVFVERLAGYLASIEQRLRAAELERAAESARAKEAQARAAVERSRRRRTVALAASLLALTILGGLTFTYLLQQRQARFAAADRILAEVTTLLAQARTEPEEPARWQAVLTASRRIDGLALSEGARARLDILTAQANTGATTAGADQELLSKLIDFRLAQIDSIYGFAAEAAYADAFRAAAYDIEAQGPEAVGGKIKSRPASVATALAAGLDDWAMQRLKARPKDAAGWRRLVTAARIADPDPWRDTLRGRFGARDEAAATAFRAMADDPKALEGQPAASLLLLASQLRLGIGDRVRAEKVLRTAWRLSPGDFLVNYELAKAPGAARNDEGIELADFYPRPVEAMRFLTAAVALRPGSYRARYSLASAMAASGDVPGAVEMLREWIRLKPDDARAHSDLGLLLQYQGRLSEAISELHEAIRLKPDDAGAHSGLGSLLRDQGKLDEAISEINKAIRLVPQQARFHDSLAWILHSQGKVGEAISEFREAIRLDPNDALGHAGLGGALNVQGKLEESAKEYREAIRLKPDDARSHCCLGLLLRAQGNLAESLAELRTGHALGSNLPGWSVASADLVRRAELLVALADRLPALLRGEDQPKGGAERLDLAQFGYETKHFVAATRLWAEALNANPKLADDMLAGHRYNAACAAALAGCGEGKDDPKPDEAARAKLRGQALGWLKGELAAWTNRLESSPPQVPPLVIRTLVHWKADPDLVGVRDQSALAKLPKAESEEWRLLWAKVDDLLKRAMKGTP